MTNGDKFLSSLTINDIAKYIRERFCGQSDCDGCPVSNHCNRIFDRLTKGSEDSDISSLDVILYWLNDYRDYMFYSHEKVSKQKPRNGYELQYQYRNRCNVCGKSTNTYGLARIGISGSNSGYKLLAKVCEGCFPKVCKALKIAKPDFAEPYWSPPKQPRADGKTFCANCGKGSPAAYNFCPRCGERLDR